MYHVAEKIQKEVSMNILGSRKVVKRYIFYSELGVSPGQLLIAISVAG